MIRTRYRGLLYALSGFLLSTPSGLSAAPPMRLLGVDDPAAIQQGAAEEPPTAEKALAAIERIIGIWPELAGQLPKDKPRYNGEDIGHIVVSTKVGFIKRRAIEGRMVKAMVACGITMPEDPAKFVEGETRHIDRDDNEGAERSVTQEDLEQLQEDTTLVKAFMTKAADGKKLPVNPNGLAVADWHGIRIVVKGFQALGR